MSSPASSIFASIANAVSPDFSQQLADTQQTVQVAYAALFGVQLVIAAELFLIAVMIYKKGR